MEAGCGRSLRFCVQTSVSITEHAVEVCFLVQFCLNLSFPVLRRLLLSLQYQLGRRRSIPLAAENGQGAGYEFRPSAWASDSQAINMQRGQDMFPQLSWAGIGHDTDKLSFHPAFPCLGFWLCQVESCLSLEAQSLLFDIHSHGRAPRRQGDKWRNNVVGIVSESLDLDTASSHVEIEERCLGKASEAMLSGPGIPAGATAKP